MTYPDAQRVKFYRMKHEPVYALGEAEAVDSVPMQMETEEMDFAYVGPNADKRTMIHTKDFAPLDEMPSHQVRDFERRVRENADYRQDQVEKVGRLHDFIERNPHDNPTDCESGITGDFNLFDRVRDLQPGHNATLGTTCYANDFVGTQ